VPRLRRADLKLSAHIRIVRAVVQLPARSAPHAVALIPKCPTPAMLHRASGHGELTIDLASGVANDYARGSSARRITGLKRCRLGDETGPEIAGRSSSSSRWQVRSMVYGEHQLSIDASLARLFTIVSERVDDVD
jgi:hypothetical protein